MGGGGLVWFLEGGGGAYGVVGGFGGAGGDGGLRAAGVVGGHFASETLGGGGVDVVEADGVCWGELGLQVASHLVALMVGVRYGWHWKAGRQGDVPFGPGR